MRPEKAKQAAEIEPARVRAVREGNALWPGLFAFTGVSFLIYLAVKGASGAAEADAGLFAQLGLAGALAAYGGWLMARARYFYVEVETAEGRRRIAGLTKTEQQALAARFRG
jgi:hypothetical protein